jgi:Zn-dependent protease
VACAGQRPVDPPAPTGGRDLIATLPPTAPRPPGGATSIDLERTLILIGVLIPSVIIHEIAHGWVALRFGDDTAKRAGRLTLNPVPHIDLFGTVILPVLLALSGLGVIGYAKPVPVNPSRMRRPRDHSLIVSLSGPAVNIVFAIAAAYALRALVAAAGPTGPDPLLAEIILWFGVVNVVLAAFNLIPIPPLDGSAVIERFLPVEWLGRWYGLQRYAMGILIILVLVIPGAVRWVFDIAFDVWFLLL